MRLIPVGQYNHEGIPFINYGRDGNKIFIIKLDDKGNNSRIQYNGVSCSQAIIRGFIFKTFKDKSWLFNSNFWYSQCRWGEYPKRLTFQYGKPKEDKINWGTFNFKKSTLDEINRLTDNYAKEHSVPAEDILNKIIKTVNRLTKIQFEFDGDNTDYEEGWAEAYVPLKYKNQKYILTWHNCD